MAPDVRIGRLRARACTIDGFHDHVRIDHALFGGAPVAHHGETRPDLGRPGPGIAFKHQDAERFAA